MSVPGEVFRLACVIRESSTFEVISAGVISRAELRAKAHLSAKDTPSTLISILTYPQGETQADGTISTPLDFLGGNPVHCSLVDFEIVMHIMTAENVATTMPTLIAIPDDSILTWETTPNPFRQSVTVCGDAGPREATLVYARECCGLAKK